MAYEGFGQPMAFVCVFSSTSYVPILTVRRKFMITDVWVYESALDGFAIELSSNGSAADIASGGIAATGTRYDRIPLVGPAKPVIASGSPIYGRYTDLISRTCKVVIEGRAVP